MVPQPPIKHSFPCLSLRISLSKLLWGIVSYTWWYQLGMSKYMIRNDEEGRWLSPSPIRGEGRRRC